MVLVAIFLAYSLTRFLTDAASGLLDGGEVLRLTLLKGVIALEVLLPLALYFGIIIGFGRLNANSELTAMRAGGLRRGRLQRPLLVASVLLAALVAALSLSVRPWAYSELFTLRDAARASSELDRIKAGRFYLYDDGERAVYVDRIARDGGRLTGIFIRNRNGNDTEIITAPSGVLEPFATPRSHRLVLNEASIFRNVRDEADFLGRFGTLSLSLDALKPIDHEYRTKSADTAALILSELADDRAELQWRLSTPVSTLLLALTAMALTDHRPRQARYARVPAAIGIYALYFNLVGVGRTWVEQQTLPSLWWAPALLAAALAVLTLTRCGRLT